MPLASDITLDSSKFHPENINDEAKNANAFIMSTREKSVSWHGIEPKIYREMVEDGKTMFPVPTYLPEAKDATLPSRDAGRDIPLRVYRPDNGEKSKGVLLHIHGGGFVLATHKHYDGLLKTYANACQITMISVGYRLAPENPFPAAVHDCIDAAEYLVDHAEEEYGAKLLLIGGDSAGANLVATSAFQLMRSRPAYQLAGLVFLYGFFDLTLNLPGVSTFTKPLVINVEDLQMMTDYYTSGMSIPDRRNPLISPLYEDIRELALSVPSKSLPPAIFLCGTEDPLLDDTMVMSTKWLVAGGDAAVKIYSGAPHGFETFDGFTIADEARAEIFQFIREKVDISQGAGVN